MLVNSSFLAPSLSLARSLVPPFFRLFAFVDEEPRKGEKQRERERESDEEKNRVIKKMTRKEKRNFSCARMTNRLTRMHHMAIRDQHSTMHQRAIISVVCSLIKDAPAL